MDDEVHGFTSDVVNPNNEIEHSNKQPAYNGKGALSQHKKKAKAKDMGERGYDPEVYGMAGEIVSAINGQERPDSPWIDNGVNNVWPEPSNDYAFAEHRHKKNKHHHKKPDVAERGMDEEVHGFVWHAIPPLNTRVKSDDAFVPNGSDAKAIDPSFAEKKHHKKPDVAERGMDEEVHGLVWHAIPPLNTRVKSDDAFVPNGSDSTAIDPSFAEKKHHKKPDVAERGMDEEVHGFVWHAIPPLNTRVKSEDAFVPNGSDASAIDPSFSQSKHHHKKHKRDIIGKGKWPDEV